jgi:DNA recombination protein RmuC
MSVSILMSVLGALVATGGIFFLFKTLTSELQKVRETLNSETSKSRGSLDEALSLNRMESRQVLQLAVTDVQARLQTFQNATESKLETIRIEVDKKLSDTVTKNFQSFDAVAKRLEELQTVTGQVINLSQGVRDLSRILESPKLRGAMGEFQLGEMLRQVLPGDVFEEQYAIDGRSKESVDAVIKLKEGMLCIDSKFPLNNARLLFDPEQTEETLKPIRKAFAQDVKAMVNSIAAKYIIPEKTLDFAFMFIPAESVYHELAKDGDLNRYCLEKHVIPVSPNSFYAYLQAIAVGFRGLKIQSEAKKIEAVIMALKNDFQKFGGDFTKVGKHLKDAQTQYENVITRVEKFGVTIDRLGMVSEEVAPSAAKEESFPSLI